MAVIPHLRNTNPDYPSAHRSMWKCFAHKFPGHCSGEILQSFWRTTNVTSEEKAASKEGLKKDYGREVLRLAPKEKPLTSRVNNEVSSSRLRNAADLSTKHSYFDRTARS